MKKYFILMMVFSAMLAVCGVLMKDVPAFKPRLSFINRSWAKVHLQVREGNDPDVNKDNLVCDRVLLKGEKLILKATSARILMYRTDSNPDQADGKHFTDWAYSDCEDANCVIDNL